MVLVLLDMLDRKLVRRSLEESSEVADRAHVDPAREFAVASDGQIALEQLSQFAHVVLLVVEKGRRQRRGGV